MLGCYEAYQSGIRLRSRILLLLLLLPLLGGCSSMRLLYANLDRAVVWRATDYVDLNREQRNWLRQEARVYLHWHRHQQLEDWAALLTTLDEAVHGGMNADTLAALEADAEDLIEAMSRRALPPLVDLMAGFSDAQVAGLKRAMAESNEALNVDYEGLELAEQRSVWRGKTRDSLGRWIGGLTPEQEELLREISESIEPDNREWIAYRERWQADLLAALAQRRQGDVFEERLSELILHRERWYTDAYAELLAQRQEAYRRFALALIDSLEPRQQRRLSGRLGNLIRDFEILAASDRAAPESAGPAPRA